MRTVTVIFVRLSIPSFLDYSTVSVYLSLAAGLVVQEESSVSNLHLLLADQCTRLPGLG